MIYTVTFNPALDYMVRLDELRVGGINRTRYEQIRCGGKGINVSTVLRNLGVETVTLGFLAGFTGQALKQGLEASGIPTDFVWLKEGMTRINVKVRSGEETEINGQGPVISGEALETLFRKLDRLGRGDVLVLAGSIPSSLPEDVYQQILARLEGRGVLAVVDATGRLLRAVLPHRPFLIKPNQYELGELFGRTLTGDSQILSCARQLQEEGARNVLVSMGGEGSLLLDETGTVHRLRAPKGEVRSSVGAGDSMVAGFLAGWLETGDYAAAHRMGAAAGSATAFSDTLADRAGIEELLPRIETDEPDAAWRKEREK